MLIYEVNLYVDRDVEAEYLAWLRPHMAQLLEVDGFTGADLFRVDPGDSPTDTRVHLSAHYQVCDRASLQAYFEVHAARLRGDGLARFEGRFEASRRVLELLPG